MYSDLNCKSGKQHSLNVSILPRLNNQTMTHSSEPTTRSATMGTPAVGLFLVSWSSCPASFSNVPTVYSCATCQSCVSTCVAMTRIRTLNNVTPTNLPSLCLPFNANVRTAINARHIQANYSAMRVMISLLHFAAITQHTSLLSRYLMQKSGVGSLAIWSSSRLPWTISWQPLIRACEKELFNKVGVLC